MFKSGQGLIAGYYHVNNIWNSVEEYMEHGVMNMVTKKT